ncbi:grpE protein homolog 2, mitochondrial-like [Megalops cyprinoides]|uniref:grpE protein homolog 2, mitochondrial-like n=1 Tax=Megalops cyprinoides TaxID=118141 RepID=UPI001864E692|nr:grpE protein homolog 2, mitochondrial-like [Megalops cyprinoides]
MAIHCLRGARNNLKDLRRLQPLLSKNYSLYSTAARERSTGDDCHGDDPTDDQCRSVTDVRMLEIRASKLQEQVQDLTTRYKKALADSDMVRRRTQKFVEDAKTFGIQSFCRDLVEVADLLEQAARELEGEVLQEEGARRLCQGLARIQDRLQGVFTKHGLEKMRPVGGRYDPYQHEIVCHVAAEGVEPGSVAVVKQEGYMLHGRTIRHAHVGIAMATQEQ